MKKLLFLASLLLGLTVTARAQSDGPAERRRCHIPISDLLQMV